MSSLSNPEEFGDLNDAVNVYNTHLEMLLNTHAPIKSIKFNAEQTIWFDSSCQEARGIRRKAEQNYTSKIKLWNL